MVKDTNFLMKVLDLALDIFEDERVLDGFFKTLYSNFKSIADDSISIEDAERDVKKYAHLYVNSGKRDKEVKAKHEALMDLLFR